MVIGQGFKQGRRSDDFLINVVGQQSEGVVFHYAFGSGHCCGRPYPRRPRGSSAEIHPLQATILDDVLLRDGLLPRQPRPAPPRRDSPLLLPPTLRKCSLSKNPRHGYPRTRR